MDVAGKSVNVYCGKNVYNTEVKLKNPCDISVRMKSQYGWVKHPFSAGQYYSHTHIIN